MHSKHIAVSSTQFLLFENTLLMKKFELLNTHLSISFMIIRSLSSITLLSFTIIISFSSSSYWLFISNCSCIYESSCQNCIKYLITAMISIHFNGFNMTCDKIIYIMPNNWFYHYKYIKIFKIYRHSFYSFENYLVIVCQRTSCKSLKT